MNPPIFERVRAVIAVLLLLQSLLGCAAAEDIPQSPWARAAPMPTSRSELAAAALAGRIYVAGGIAQWGTTAAFEAYDPATDRWEELPPLPEAVHHLAAAATESGFMSLAATPICYSARSQSAPGHTTPGRGDGPGLRICRARGQRTAWRQSRAGSTWSAA